MTRMEEFRKNLTAMKDKLEPILKSDVDKFIEIAANYVEQNPSLLEKDINSLYFAITRAAQNGLYLDGNEAALVPFKGQIKFMSMYKGLLKQVRNSGELASINCGVVYEGDTFEYSVDENGEHLKHVPKFVGRTGKTERISSYAIARIKEGQAPYIEVMTEDEINNCKKSSRAGDDSPWNGLFSDEMRKKTVLRRISKRLPSSTDLNAAIHEDDDLFIPPKEPETSPAPAPETSSRLRDAVAPAKPEETGNMVDGIIDETKTFTVQKDGKPATLYACKISGVQYLTFDAEIYKLMNSAKASKAKVTLFFKKEISATKKEYNDIINIMMPNIPDEEVPI